MYDTCTSYLVNLIQFLILSSIQADLLKANIYLLLIKINQFTFYMHI